MRFREMAGGRVIEGGRGGGGGAAAGQSECGQVPDRRTQSNLCVSDPSSVRR